MASHLLKFVHYLYDAFGLRIELKYLRDIDQREVDFVITVDNDPIFLVETKLGDQKISTSQKYFTKKLSASNSYQVVLEEGIDYYSSRYGSRVLSASKFLSGLI